MTDAEKRIQQIEGLTDFHNPVPSIVSALCEIARQLARSNDLREFELGVEADTGTPRTAFRAATEHAAAVAADDDEEKSSPPWEEKEG